jgi:hypothetical protein
MDVVCARSFALTGEPTVSDLNHPTALHQYVHDRFRAAFGQPSNSLEKDDHWAMETTNINQPINILVNGTPAAPAVWVFDPHELAMPVYSTSLISEEAVDNVIVLIQTRVKRDNVVRSPKSGDPTGKD